MTSLSIRKLPDDVYARLRVRAARAGRSIEAEVREILAEAVAGEPAPRFDLQALQELVRETVGPGHSLSEELIGERRREAEKEAKENGQKRRSA